MPKVKPGQVVPVNVMCSSKGPDGISFGLGMAFGAIVAVIIYGLITYRVPPPQQILAHKTTKINVISDSGRAELESILSQVNKELVSLGEEVEIFITRKRLAANAQYTCRTVDGMPLCSAIQPLYESLTFNFDNCTNNQVVIYKDGLPTCADAPKEPH